MKRNLDIVSSRFVFTWGSVASSQAPTGPGGIEKAVAALERTMAFSSQKTNNPDLVRPRCWPTKVS